MCDHSLVYTLGVAAVAGNMRVDIVAVAEVAGLSRVAWVSSLVS